MLTYKQKLRKANRGRIKGDINLLNKNYYVPVSSAYSVLKGLYKNDFIVNCLLMIQEDLKK